MPKIIDHDERRAEISAAVIRVVARDGVGGVTMREVAAEAGWSTGVLNHYFQNKKALLVGGLRQAARETGRNLNRAMKERHGPDRVRAVLEEGMPLDERREGFCAIFFFFWAEGLTDPDLSAELAKYYNAWRTVVREAIELGQAEGWVRPGLDAQMLSETLVALADGLAIQSTFDREQMTTERSLRHVHEWIEFISPGASAAVEPAHT